MRYYGPLIDGGGDENSNQRENRVTETRAPRAPRTTREPEFTGPSKYSPFVTPEPTKTNTSPAPAVDPLKIMSERYQAMADAYFAANPDLDPLTGKKRITVSDDKTEDNSGVVVVGNVGGASLVATSYVEPTPLSPSPISTAIVTPPPPPVKTATLDIILFDEEATTVDTMADLIFENIGGQELINITRSDIINGQKISYQPIKNLSSIQQRYNPNNILSLQQTADKYFAGFSIKLEDKIPNEGNGANGENIYIEDGTGDLIIEFININNDEQIEVQITSDGIIYEANLGEINS